MPGCTAMGQRCERSSPGQLVPHAVWQCARSHIYAMAFRTTRQAQLLLAMLGCAAASETYAPRKVFNPDTICAAQGAQAAGAGGAAGELRGAAGQRRSTGQGCGTRLTRRHFLSLRAAPGAGSAGSWLGGRRGASHRIAAGTQRHWTSAGV